MNAGSSSQPHNAYLIPLPRGSVAYMTDRYVRRRTEVPGASEYFHDGPGGACQRRNIHAAMPGLAVAKHKQ